MWQRAIASPAIAGHTAMAAQGCSQLDADVAVLSVARFAALGCVVLYGARRRLASGQRGPKAWLRALFAFTTEEGEHMAIYFFTSFALDTFAVFGESARPSGVCRSDTLVALYSAGMLSFIPSALLACCLKAPSDSQQADCVKRGARALAAFLVAACSFGVRVRAVRALKYESWIHGALSRVSLPLRAALSASTPVAVDLGQSVLLIAARRAASSAPHRSEYAQLDA